jgi:hypothetical protein
MSLFERQLYFAEFKIRPFCVLNYSVHFPIVYASHFALVFSEVQKHVRYGPKYLHSKSQLCVQLIEYEALNTIQFPFGVFH